jgi:hypothetical protein
MLRAVSMVGVVGVLSLIGTGCDVEVEPESLGTAAQQLGGDCDPWECGTNSPQINSFGFHELNLNGIPEPESGFRFLGFKRGQNTYTLQVVHGRIIGTSAGIQIQGQGLVGAYLLVGKGSAPEFTIQIQQVGSVPYWAGGGVAQVESYLLQWSPVPTAMLSPAAAVDPFRDLCSNPPPRDSPDVFHMNTRHALVFEGDRIDGHLKKEYDLDTSWFNIGCAGHTLAKMYLTGHVQAAENDGFMTTLAQRTAIIKMFSADYCGTGAAYTVAGMPLGYRDDLDWLAFRPPLPVGLEARWSETGAVCVKSLRGAVNPTDLFKNKFPNGPWAQMGLDGCRPAICRDNDPNVLNGAHLVTGNP